MGLDILKECNSPLELPSVDGLRGLSGVLEGHSEVASTSPG